MRPPLGTQRIDERHSAITVRNPGFRRLACWLVSCGIALSAPVLWAAEVPTASAADPVTAESAASPPLTRGDAQETGFEWGLRLAAELPLGNADGGSTHGDGLDVRSRGAMQSVAPLGVPLILDLGYRTSRNWWLGISAQAGLGIYGNACPDKVKCSWSEVRIGASALYGFSPENSVNPWLGFGVGYEWLRLWGLGKLAPETSVSGQRELLGGPQVNILGGVAFRLTDSLSIGPYASAAAGMYLTSHFLCRGAAQCESNSSVEEKAVHVWLSAGVRGSYGP